MCGKLEPSGTYVRILFHLPPESPCKVVEGDLLCLGRGWRWRWGLWWCVVRNCLVSILFVTTLRFMAFATEAATMRRWPIFSAVEMTPFVCLFWLSIGRPATVWAQLTAGKGFCAKRSPLLGWNVGLRQKRSREDEREAMAEFEVDIGNCVWVSFGQAVEDLKARNNRRRSSNPRIHGYMWEQSLCQPRETTDRGSSQVAQRNGCALITATRQTRVFGRLCRLERCSYAGYGVCADSLIEI